MDECAHTQHIKSFYQIGMLDPFPLEPEPSEPFTEDIDVYPASKYIDGASPNMLYLPCNKVLFKIMRACIGVQFK